jgi:hypothetical protein
LIWSPAPGGVPVDSAPTNAGRPAELSTSPVGAGALRFAAVWLVCLAVPAGIVGAAIIWFSAHPLFGDAPSGAGLVNGTLFGLSLVCIPLGSALVAWRAASPDRVPERWASFALGAGTIGLLVGSCAAALLPWYGGFYGLSMYRLADAARLPWSVAVLVPAACMVLGTTRRWRVAREGETDRRTRIVAAVAAVIVVPMGALIALAILAPSCPPGRVCVPEAGVSFVQPAGWSPAQAASGDLYAASAGSDETRFVVQDGAKVLHDAGRGVSPDFALVKTTVAGAVENGGGFFGTNSDVTSREVDLPVGPSLRVAFTHTTAFIIAMRQTSITYWFRVGDRLVVLEYMESYGEGTPGPTETDPPAFRELLETLRPL